LIQANNIASKELTRPQRTRFTSVIKAGISLQQKNQDQMRWKLQQGNHRLREIHLIHQKEASELLRNFGALVLLLHKPPIDGRRIDH
tara:strand:+ start:283 stop:543 length:261 start_codon:yes stop_codon:yes gene_type:complete